jgi:hypothetical protein
LWGLDEAPLRLHLLLRGPDYLQSVPSPKIMVRARWIIRQLQYFVANPRPAVRIRRKPGLAVGTFADAIINK